MDGKEDIVGADEVVLSVVAVAVLVLDGGAEEEGEVEDRVAKEAQDVEKDKVERQALYRLASVVKDGLWVEAGRPRDEVRPANDVGSERSESSELHGWVVLCVQLCSCWRVKSEGENERKEIGWWVVMMMNANTSTASKR